MMKKTSSPSIVPRKNVQQDLDATRLLSEQIKEAEKQLKEGKDPIDSIQKTATKAAAQYDANPRLFVDVLCLMMKSVTEKMAKVKANRAQMDYLAQRIHTIRPTLVELNTDIRGYRALRKPLEAMQNCVKACDAQAIKFSDQTWYKRIINLGADKKTFEQLALRLNDAISQIQLTLNVEQSQVMDKVLKCQEEMKLCQERDVNAIRADMSNIIKLEEDSRLELRAIRETQQRFSMNQKQYQAVLGQQLEALHLDMAKKLELDAAQQQVYFEEQFSKLNQRFQELNAPIKRRNKPPIPADLSISFYDVAIDDFIQEGTFGMIYRGEWLGVPVAVKKMGGRIQDDTYHYFINELSNLAKLRHPNIIRVYGAFLEPEACLVTEYASQGSLKKVLSEKQMGLLEKAQIATDLGYALRYLHEHDGIHRNLTPKNVLIDESGRAKLSDFGLAKAMNKNVATVSVIHDQIRRTNEVENLIWLAPELTYASKATTASDIYNLGLTLFYLFSGESLFAHIPAEPDQVELAVRHGNIDERIEEKIPADYQKLILSCVQINPELRPTAQDVSNILAETQRKVAVNSATTVKQQLSQFGALSPRSVHTQGTKLADEKRYTEAYKCYLHAADAGYFRAETDLGVALLKGRGCARDPKAAYERLLSAAQKGHARAQFNLAMMFEFGDGINKDLMQALHWYEKSAEQQNPDAQKKLAELRASMSPYKSSGINSY